MTTVVQMHAKKQIQMLLMVGSKIKMEVRHVHQLLQQHCQDFLSLVC